MDKSLKWVLLEDDNAGYYILSYDVETNQPLYIEVKTITGTKFTSFYMSAGEIKFSKKNVAHYKLYRIFNFRNSVAGCFALDGNISASADVQMDAFNYIVTLK